MLADSKHIQADFVCKLDLFHEIAKSLRGADRFARRWIRCRLCECVDAQLDHLMVSFPLPVRPSPTIARDARAPAASGFRYRVLHSVERLCETTDRPVVIEDHQNTSDRNDDQRSVYATADTGPGEPNRKAKGTRQMSDCRVRICRHQLHRLIEAPSRYCCGFHEKRNAREAEQCEAGKESHEDEEDEQQRRTTGDERVNPARTLVAKPDYSRALCYFVVARRVLESVDEEDQRDENRDRQRSPECDRGDVSRLHV